MKKFFLLTLCVAFFLPAMANAAPTASDAIANAEAEAAQPKVKKKKMSKAATTKIPKGSFHPGGSTLPSGKKGKSKADADAECVFQERATFDPSIGIDTPGCKKIGIDTPGCKKDD